MNINRQAVLAAAMTLALSLPAVSASADDLRGYSIDVTTVETDVFRADDPRSIDFTMHRRIYIGQAGDIFDYTDQSAGGFTQHGANVIGMDRAKTMPHDRLRAWTMQGNRLQAIVKATEGIVVRTIDVDPSRTTCTYQIAMQPDPGTGRWWCNASMGTSPS